MFPKKSCRKPDAGESNQKKAVVLFSTLREGILAEQVLQNQGFKVRKVAPPTEHRKGCEISIEILVIHQQDVEKILVEKGLQHQGIIPL